MNWASPGFIILASTGAIYAIAGYILWKKPPKKINDLYGYRTKRAMKTQAAWDFAQVYSGKLMFYLGLASVLLSLLYVLFETSQTFQIISSLILILIPCVVLLVKTEDELKQIAK